MDSGKYTYTAKVVGVYDGDTITVDIDLGLGIWKRGEKLRLFGINAPEIRGDERPQGIESRDWLRNAILDKVVVIRTFKDRKGKYGRYLADVWLDGLKVNELLVDAGLAEYREY